MKFPSVVSDVMKDIISIEADVFISEAAQRMIENKIGSIIITENGEPKGIITRSDMIKRVIVTHKDPRETTAGSVMSKPLISIEACTPILDAMRYIRDHDINQVLLSENSKFVGIVSEGDLVRAVTLCSLTQFSSLLRRP
ncbi:MAG: CBS domain-containing protein [Candidatus Bathyarchaeota archaeon]|nr:CBS domain-containing protein [Candidatus Bathyarchaeota archaeon]